MLAISFAGFCTFLDLYATQPILPLFETLFHATKAEAGLTVSASTIAVAMMAPFVGALGDRARRKSVIVLAIVVLAIPTLLAATSSGLAALVMWRFFQGVATPGVYVIALAYVTEEAGPGRVGTVMAAFVTGTVLGGLSGRVLTGLVAAHTGWREAFVVLGIINLAGAAATWRWLPSSRHHTPRAGAGPVAPLAGLRDRRLVATYAIGFNVLFTLVALFTYVTFYLSAPPFSLGTAAVSGVFVVYLVGAVATPIAGRFIDRVGPRVVLVGALTAGALGALITLGHSLLLVIVGLAIACSGIFICQAAATSYLRIASTPALRALASGAYVTVYYLGGSAGGVVPGLVWERAGWAGCVALVVASQITAAILALWFWDPPSQQADAVHAPA
jgi:predicted MFS family arabinose efflux permease